MSSVLAGVPCFSFVVAVEAEAVEVGAAGCWVGGGDHVAFGLAPFEVAGEAEAVAEEGFSLLGVDGLPFFDDGAGVAEVLPGLLGVVALVGWVVGSGGEVVVGGGEVGVELVDGLAGAGDECLGSCFGWCGWCVAVLALWSCCWVGGWWCVGECGEVVGGVVGVVVDGVELLLDALGPGLGPGGEVVLVEFGDGVSDVLGHGVIVESYALLGVFCSFVHMWQGETWCCDLSLDRGVMLSVATQDSSPAKRRRWITLGSANVLDLSTGLGYAGVMSLGLFEGVLPVAALAGVGGARLVSVVEVDGVLVERASRAEIDLSDVVAVYGLVDLPVVRRRRRVGYRRAS